MKDVTIIIPVYVTSEETFDWACEAIQSAKEQDCEVIVYNDGSPYVDLQHKLISKFSDTLVFGSDVNHGVSFSRNKLAEMVTTNLFIPLDCDDKFAPGAIDKLLSVWKGVPVYPDISKFGLETVVFYRLLDFDCNQLTKKLGISSVNVLQSKEQWKAIGGWNEEIDLYEDAEYNARLLGTYCGQNFHEPLVFYRQHGNQRTKKHAKISSNISTNILDMIRRYTMPCSSCGSGRRSQAMQNNVVSSGIGARPLQSRIADLPGSQGSTVLAHYIGGNGMGYHYYRGPVTKYSYKVIFDELIYVDPRDACEPDATRRTSLLIHVHKDDEVPAPVAGESIVKLEEPERKPVLKVEKQPVLSAMSDEELSENLSEGEFFGVVTDIIVDDVNTKEPEDDIFYNPSIEEISGTKMEKELLEVKESGLPDISNLSVREIRNLELTPEMAKKLLKIEKDGLDRERVVEFFENVLKG
jgi:glycosyltransferase involved in cell wall biosynthesis